MTGPWKCSAWKANGPKPDSKLIDYEPSYGLGVCELQVE